MGTVPTAPASRRRLESSRGGAAMTGAEVEDSRRKCSNDILDHLD